MSHQCVSVVDYKAANPCFDYTRQRFFIRRFAFQFGLDHLSTIILGHADVEEDKEKLGEMLAKVTSKGPTNAVHIET